MSGDPTRPSADIATELDANAPNTAPPSAAPARVYLIAELGDESRLLDLAVGDEVTIGRAEDATLVVDETRVSRHHARILRRGSETVVEDLGSRNGTRVGADVLRGASRPVLAGDVVRVGSLEIVVASSAGRLQPALASAAADDDLVVADQAMVKVFELARRLAPKPTTVLLLGETGVGKEIVAEQLHRFSTRVSGPFVRLSCASLPDALLESELFGYEKGAFTGAGRQKKGYFEAADGGTLLLDEIGELVPSTQVKLLRVLEGRTLVRLGGTEEIGIDVRLVCATHRDLEAEVAAGRFRQDLYYRISTVTLSVPPLRERPMEIVLLAELFLRQLAKRAGSPVPRLDRDAMAALTGYAWPGNVRELRNAVEHACVMAEGGPVRPEHLPAAMRSTGGQPGRMRDRLEEIERKNIEAALAANGGNQTRTATALGLSRRALVYKLAKYGIKR